MKGEVEGRFCVSVSVCPLERNLLLFGYHTMLYVLSCCTPTTTCLFSWWVTSWLPVSSSCLSRRVTSFLTTRVTESNDFLIWFAEHRVRGRPIIIKHTSTSFNYANLVVDVGVLPQHFLLTNVFNVRYNLYCISALFTSLSLAQEEDLTLGCHRKDSWDVAICSTKETTNALKSGKKSYNDLRMKKQRAKS